MRKTTIQAWHWAILSAVGVCAAGAWGISCVGEPSVDLNGVKGEKPPETTCTVASDCDDTNACTTDQCDGSGVCKHTPNPAAVPPNSGNVCQPYKCNEEGMLVQETLADGTPCGMDTNVVLICRQGACVPGCVKDGDCGALTTGYCFEFSCVSCADNKKNGDEAGVDCGGEHCKKCPGEACTNSTSCVTGHCTDGVCCDEACGGTCEACSAAGHCEAIPYGQPDDTCSEIQLCDSDGSCKLALGKICNNKYECLSGMCHDKPALHVCVRTIGSPCTVEDRQECITWYCDPMTLLCALAPSGSPCIHDNQCASENCVGMTCQ